MGSWGEEPRGTASGVEGMGHEERRGAGRAEQAKRKAGRGQESRGPAMGSGTTRKKGWA